MGILFLVLINQRRRGYFYWIKNIKLVLLAKGLSKLCEFEFLEPIQVGFYKDKF